MTTCYRVRLRKGPTLMTPIISADSPAEAAEKAIRIAIGIPEAEPWGSYWQHGKSSIHWTPADVVVEGVTEHHPPSTQHIDRAGQKALVAAARAAA